MMSSLKKIAATTATLCALTLAPFAHAGLVTFDIKWANASGVTTAVAELTLEAGLIETSPFPPDRIGADQLSSFKLTVTGASAGNGIFTAKDFEAISFYTAGVVDFNQELIGQHMIVGSGPNAREFIYGDQWGMSGAFDLFALSDTTPSTVSPFAMVTDRTAAEPDFLRVSSIRARDSVAAVPEPQTYAMLLAGLGLLAVRARRRA